MNEKTNINCLITLFATIPRNAYKIKKKQEIDLAYFL